MLLFNIASLRPITGQQVIVRQILLIANRSRDEMEVLTVKHKSFVMNGTCSYSALILKHYYVFIGGKVGELCNKKRLFEANLFSIYSINNSLIYVKKDEAI